MRKKLNLPEKEICEKYQNGLNIHELAKEYNCSPSTIHNRLYNNGIIFRLPFENSKSFIIELPIKEISEKYKNGISSIKLAKEYNCTSQTIISRLRDNGIIIRSHIETTKKLKLPVEEICKKYQDGMSTTELGNEYGCTSSTILNRLHSNDITIRTPGDIKIIKLPIDEICEKYLNGMTTTELGEEYECSGGVICKRLYNMGINVLKESHKHLSVTQQGVSYNNWNGFISQQKYCSLFNEKFKEKIRIFYNRRCFLCGKSEEESNRKHAIHHVNYNKSCLCGLICEFVPLCTSCHSKTNGNRKYWEDLIMCYLYPERYFLIDL